LLAKGLKMVGLAAAAAVPGGMPVLAGSNLITASAGENAGQTVFD